MEYVIETADSRQPAFDGLDWREVLDLGVPTNPLGPPPGVRAAVQHAIDRIVRYPERFPDRLREAMAATWKVRPDQILLGNGATELIYFLARAWLREASIVAIPTRPEYLHAHRHAKQVDWKAPDKWPKQGLLIFSQPNSVTGLALSFERIRNALLATNNPVLIDESFIDFTDLTSALTLIDERPNVFVLRSMSNFYALPGLRIGALVGGTEAIASLLEHREPWQINVIAEAAALAALEDKDYLSHSKQVVAQERAWIWSQMRSLPSLSPIRGEANFFLIHLANGAADLCSWFSRRKVIVENCTGWPGIDGDAVRLAIRTRQENERILALLKEYICG